VGRGRGIAAAEAAVWNEKDCVRAVIGGSEIDEAGVADDGVIGNGGAIAIVVVMLRELDGPIGEFQFMSGQILDANFLAVDHGVKAETLGMDKLERHVHGVVADQKLGAVGVDG